jgi:hypothetical protein
MNANVLSKKRNDMKDEILQIAYSLEKGIIDEGTAKQELCVLLGVRLSLPDAENIDYLRGFIDGYGGEEPHGVMPDGFNDINEVWDKMYELKGNEA